LSSSFSCRGSNIQWNSECSTTVTYTADDAHANRGTPSSAASGYVHPQKKSESTTGTRSEPSDRSRAQSPSRAQCPMKAMMSVLKERRR
jgi:hypothetical protein